MLGPIGILMPVLVHDGLLNINSEASDYNIRGIRN